MAKYRVMVAIDIETDSQTVAERILKEILDPTMDYVWAGRRRLSVEVMDVAIVDES